MEWRSAGEIGKVEEVQFPRRSREMADCGGNRKSRGSSIPPEKQGNSSLRGKQEWGRKFNSPGEAVEWRSAGEIGKVEEVQFPRRSREIAVCGGKRNGRGSSIPPEEQWNSGLRGK